MRVKQQHVIEHGGGAAPQRLEVHIHGCAHKPKQRGAGEGHASRQQKPGGENSGTVLAARPCALQLTQQRRRAVPSRGEQAQQTWGHEGGAQSQALQTEATKARCVGAQGARLPPDGWNEDAVHDAIPELKVVSTVERKRRQELLLATTAWLLLQRAAGAWRHGLFVVQKEGGGLWLR